MGKENNCSNFGVKECEESILIVQIWSTCNMGQAFLLHLFWRQDKEQVSSLHWLALMFVYYLIHYKRAGISDWHEASNGDARQEDDSPAANGDHDRHMNEKQVKRAIENIAKVSSFV